MPVCQNVEAELTGKLQSEKEKSEQQQLTIDSLTGELDSLNGSRNFLTTMLDDNVQRRLEDCNSRLQR